MAEKGKATVDRTEDYLDNDVPMLLKLLFYGLIIWGIVFALWFILGGYNSEKRFDALKGGKAEIARTADPVS